MSRSILTSSAINWLVDYKNSESYACNSNGLCCEAFHVLAPALHTIGAFRSYSSYASIIRNSIAFACANRDNASILVAGVDSDESAMSLIGVLHPFRDWVNITFVDICATPLRRISARFFSDKPEVQTVHGDIFTHLKNNNSFDIILSDCFLQQFNSIARKEILSLFSQSLRDARSSLVLREYVGNGERLIELLWSRYNLGALDSELLRATAENNSGVLRLLTKLKSKLIQNSNIYENEEDFLLEVVASNLSVVDNYASSQVADVVCVARTQDHQFRSD